MSGWKRSAKGRTLVTVDASLHGPWPFFPGSGWQRGIIFGSDKMKVGPQDFETKTAAQSSADFAGIAEKPAPFPPKNGR